ncbi:MAG: hypothetical protein FP825_05740 [Hyphomonas sp.]|uniref:hypothetical protein n=1 Tax=Hyphomonas sp. TaxID=87 RepID=UPI001803B4BC|nr:hypothetical protein [Hyphomonas sp.]MBU3920357.1 hypothetical protein [Alphaproteobacteria bacterium]MBA3067969.1 hypothetical protein [Hyphomonas sp.]MBU4061307.1 hypothetical protein [Alphaproteobacteria bacterium]MBU4162560.1 hypothetical protein [Alphaproteobacteria bacterium]MBU4567910.1 hypothetical protein [Alphaproteobacteria bacterium]
MSFVRGPTAFVAAILAGVCGLLLLGLTLLSTGAMSRVEMPAEVRPTLTPPEMPALTASADRARASAEKPLFHPNRQPFAAESTSGAGSGAELTEAPFQLKGVVLANGMARASLQRNVEGDIEWVNLGNSIDGWTLESVRADRVALSRGEFRTTLLLYPGR